MTRDRVNGANSFMLTQEFLAQMLVMRATVGDVAAELQQANLIQYSRGLISILNRRGLEKRSCEC